MTLAHIMFGVAGYVLGMITTMIIYEKPLKGDDVEELLKRDD